TGSTGRRTLRTPAAGRPGGTGLVLNFHVFVLAAIRGLATGCVLLRLGCLRVLAGATVGGLSGGAGAGRVRLDLWLGRVLRQGGRGERKGSSNDDVLKRHVLLHGF